MKKLLAVLLVLTMLVGTLALTSCGAKPELDLDDAKDALEDAEYTVMVEDDKDTLKEMIPGLVEMLSARDKDGDNTIYIYVFDNAKTAKLFYQQMTVSRDQEIEEKELMIKFYEHILDTYENDLSSDEISEYEDELKELKKDLEESKDEFCYGRSGKTVWYGTEKAVEATKK